MSIDIFLQAFVLLFVIIEPIGTAFIFLSLTAGRPKKEVRALALKATLVAVGLLLVFALAGGWLLKQLSISLEAFRIAGGILLFGIAYHMVMSHADPTKSYENTHAPQDIAVFPIGIPLLAGPGALAAVILLFSQHSGNWVAQAQIVTAILVLGAITLLCLRGAWKLQRAIGDTGTTIIARVSGILLAALSVQFIVDGVTALAG